MTQNGTTRSIPFTMPRDCGPCGSATSGIPDRTTERQPYMPNQLINPEAADLLTAVIRARVIQEEEHTPIDDAMRAVVEKKVEADWQISAVEIFVRSGELATAHRVAGELRELHSRDGPESRRYRPKWVGWLLWTTVALAAVYDTTFLANVFLVFLDGAWDWTSITTYIALIPGVLIAAALLFVGNVVAESICRARSHKEREKRKNRDLGPGDMPWPRWGLALSGLAVVLGTLGVWAWIRAETVGQRDEYIPVAPWAMVLLVVLFALTAIAMKVWHHNPYIERTAETDQQKAQATDKGAELVNKMSAAMAGFEFAVADLRAKGDLVDGRARRVVDEAFVSILKARDAHGLAGDVAPHFTPEASTKDYVFHEITEPALSAKVRERVEEFLQRHALEKLRARCEQALEDLRKSITEKK